MLHAFPLLLGSQISMMARVALHRTDSVKGKLEVVAVQILVLMQQGPTKRHLADRVLATPFGFAGVFCAFVAVARCVCAWHVRVSLFCNTWLDKTLFLEFVRKSFPCTITGALAMSCTFAVVEHNSLASKVQLILTASRFGCCKEDVVGNRKVSWQEQIVGSDIVGGRIVVTVFAAGSTPAAQ